MISNNSHVLLYYNISLFDTRSDQPNFKELELYSFLGISNPEIKCHLFILKEPFDFLFVILGHLVSVESTWHITDVQKLATGFTSLSDF